MHSAPTAIGCIEHPKAARSYYNCPARRYSSRLAAQGSAWAKMALTTATPASPLPCSCSRLAASMPPMATTGMLTAAVTALETELLPLAEVITPNIPEAEILCGHSIKTAADMENAAKEISQKFGCNVLCKGGHNLNDANDLLVLTDGSAAWFNGQRIDNPNTHGTGCTLSSAIASNLAKGYDLETAVRRAKAYISGALAAMLDLGHGSGPMNHAFALDNEWSKEAEA